MKTRILALLVSLIIATEISAAELTVHAAASLTDAMNEIGPAYEKQSRERNRYRFAGNHTGDDGSSAKLTHRTCEGEHRSSNDASHGKWQSDRAEHAPFTRAEGARDIFEPRVHFLKGTLCGARKQSSQETGGNF